jgi:hypothetical protein
MSHCSLPYGASLSTVDDFSFVVRFTIVGKVSYLGAWSEFIDLK